MKTDGRGNTLHVPPGYILGSQLAALVGKHKDTIARWRNNGLLPFDYMDSGKLRVYIYDAEAQRVALTLAMNDDYRLTDRVA